MAKINQKESVALSSVFASLFLTGGKLMVGVVTMSLGIISEAVHSALDLGAALLTYFAVRVSDKPADERHQFGHTKTESVSALIETGLLFLTSGWIIYESIKRLFFESVEVEATWYAFAIIVISIVVDFSRSRALAKVAKQTKSQALEADALHFSSDIWSSAVVLVGLALVSFGVNGADAIAALAVAVLVIVAGWRLGKRTIDVLIDAAPEGTAEKIAGIVIQVDGVLNIEKLRVRPAGSALFIDLLVGVNRKLPQAKVEQIIKNIEAEVKKYLPQADLSVSVKPMRIDSETIAEKVQLVAANYDVSVHDISVQSLAGKLDVSFDLEISQAFSVEKAHEIASQLEDQIRKELAEEVTINTHIEPVDEKTLIGQPVGQTEIEEINRLFAKIKNDLPLVKNLHEISIKRFGENYFIAIHASFNNDLSLEAAHNISSQIEYLARQHKPAIKRVVVHSEPVKE
ncbi:MAG: cation diffusion facilitator family transporter [Patescibacteria group bacterium]|jgi:cation diffusion facilitator family transporter